MNGVILSMALLLLLGAIAVGIFSALFSDTATFRAIDEKIAKLIRGKEDE